jgi:PAS domain S-box-containing protein
MIEKAAYLKKNIKKIGLFFLCGSVILIIFSFIEKSSAGFDPFALKSYLVPCLFGGLSFTVIGIFFIRCSHAEEELRKSKEHLEEIVSTCTTELRVTNEKLKLETADRKQVEERLRESEREKSVILDAMSELVAYQDLNHTVLWTNRAAAASVNETQENLLGRKCYEIWAGREEPCDNCPVAETIESGTAHRNKTFTPDGRAWIITGYPIKNDVGEIIGAVEVTTDITKREQVEESLRKSEEKYKDLYDNAPVGYMEIDIEGNITNVNRKELEMLDYTSEEILGKYLWNFVLGEKARKTIKAILSGSLSPSKGLERHYIRKDGSTFPVLIDDFVVKDESGRIIGMRIINRDITDLKQAEKDKDLLIYRYKEKAKEMEAMFNGTKLLLEDENFETTARKIFDICRGLIGAPSGYVARLSDDGTRNEVLFLESGGLPCTVSPELPMPVRGLREEAYRSDRAVFENDFLNSKWMKYIPEGHVDVKNVLFAPLKDSNKTVGIIGLANKEDDFNDNDAKIISAFGEMAAISFRQSSIREALDKSEKRLFQAEKLESLGILAGGIAHDFNNILTTILGNVSMAKDQAASRSEISELLTEAATASKRAQTLTKQLLTFAKGGTPVKETASVGDIIKESSLFVMRGSKSGCEFSIAEDLWTVEVDVGQVNQVINNIVINANQAMPEGGIIEIKAENLIIDEGNEWYLKPGRYVRMSFKDEGVGIAEKHLSKIFDPYFTTKHEGSGLGLATAYSIIKKHGGTIVAESLLGIGTTFHIYLPASEKEEPEKMEDNVIKGRGKILLMDDEASLRKITGKMLEKLGYEPEFAEDGDEAIRMVKGAKEAKKPYDAVILDLTIPGGIGGKEAIQKLVEIDPEIKAIVSSGYSDDPILANFREYGFKGMLPKPFELSSLGKMLHEVLKVQKE